MPMSMACQVSTIDAFPSVLNGDFELDGPVTRALAMQLAQTNPDQAALLLASRIPVEQLPAAAKDDQAINRLLSATGDSLYGGGNILGNASALNEAALRAAWQRQARNGFQALISGAKTGTIRLSPHITIEPRNIGKGGQLRKGARMIVRVRGLPMTVLHSLPSPFISKAGGQFSAMRVGARDMQRMGQATAALADARVQSSRCCVRPPARSAEAFWLSAPALSWTSAPVPAGSTTQSKSTGRVLPSVRPRARAATSLGSLPVRWPWVWCPPSAGR